MKYSGVPWIGDIPNAWKVERIKTIFKERTELSQDGSETLLSVSEYYGVANRSEKISDGEFVSRAESLVGYKKCYKGDLVSNIMLAWKGSMGITAIDGIVSPAYCVYEPSKTVHPRYYHYLFRTSLYTSIFRLYSKGIIDSRLRLYSPYFYDISAIIPSLPEQQRIASFLDRKCAEIDDMVALQEKIVEELKAYKQSVITEAITKGLNPDVPMKDSGIEWIGEIPEHWAAIRIKYLLGERKERSIKGEEEPLSMSQKYGLIPTKEMDTIPNMASSFEGAKIVYKNDLVFNKLKAHLGVFSTSDYHGLVSPDYAVYFGLGKVLMPFMEYMFKTPQYISEFRKTATGVGSGLTRLYTSDLFSMPFPLPSIEEQAAIVKHLKKKCSEIDSLINIKQSKIESLKEYKKSIIYEYATGKKEVIE